jgi:two-component system phosphate regulon sensor histidine kinase PhoR
MGIRSRIFLLIFLSLTASITITYIVAERDLSNTFEEQTLAQLQKQASILLEYIDEVDSLQINNNADSIADRLGKASDSRVSLILNNGKVIGDSYIDENELTLLDDHSNREEFIEAMQSGVGWASRYSSSVNQQQLYFAIRDNNEVSPNVIRIAVPYTYIDEALQSLDLSLLLVALVALLVASIASGIAANYTYTSIAELEDAASNLASGSLNKSSLKALPTKRVDEFGNVARSISQISEDLKSQISLLAKQRDQFGLVLDDLGEGILVANRNGKITYCNEQCLLILSKDNLVGQQLKDMDIKSIQSLYKKTRRTKSADIEFEIEGKDRSTKWILGSMNRSKTTKEFILVIHDITQLRQLNSMRRDFVSNLSHELRTPVSVIRANSETLLESALDDKKQAKVFAKAILHNSERLTEMVSDILDLSRIEHGELKLHIEKLNLQECINESIDSLKNLGKKKNISIISNCPRRTQFVLADKKALERILTNLIDNAFKYSEENSLIKIETKSIIKNENVQITITDQGRGISDEDKAVIFDRFFRTANARASEKKGSGLGLAIVKNLVSSLNGDVGVKNPPNNVGTQFWFTLPMAK